MWCGVDVKMVSWGVVVVAIAQQLLRLCTENSDYALMHRERERERAAAIDLIMMILTYYLVLQVIYRNSIAIISVYIRRPAFWLAGR